MHPQPAYPRVYSNPRRPYDSARRATDPTAEQGTPSPLYDAPPPRIPRARRPENHARPESTAPSNMSVPRQQTNHSHRAGGGAPAGVAIARKPVGSGSSTSSSASRKQRPAAIVLSDGAGDALLGALREQPARWPPADSDGTLSSSSWSRAVDAASMDGSTAMEGSSAATDSSNLTVSSGVMVRSSATGEPAEPPPGAQSPSGPRAGGLAGAGLGAGDEGEASATTEELAVLIARAATKENLFRMRVLGLWSINILVVLYIATCLWSVVTALVDAVVRLIAPVLTFGGFLLWMLEA